MFSSLLVFSYSLSPFILTLLFRNVFEVSMCNAIINQPDFHEALYWRHVMLSQALQLHSLCGGSVTSDISLHTVYLTHGSCMCATETKVFTARKTWILLGWYSNITTEKRLVCRLIYYHKESLGLWSEILPRRKTWSVVWNITTEKNLVFGLTTKKVLSVAWYIILFLALVLNLPQMTVCLISSIKY